MSIRQRLSPEPGQQAGLVEHCHHARFVFNIGLEQRSMWRRDKHLRGDLSTARPTTTTQMRDLAQLCGDLDWLRAGSSSVQQAALRDLDRAFTNFFAGRAGYPAFKRRSEREGSFVVRDLTVRRLNRKWGVVTVPKLGHVRFRISRPWAEIEAASSARITQHNARWHIAFTTPPAEKITAGTGAAVGIDRGVVNTLATSEGQFFQAPTLTGSERARFLAVQRRISRQRKGSARRARALDQMAVLRRRLEDRRADWVEQTTTGLASIYDLIAVEDLRVANMVRRPAPKPDPDNEGQCLPNRAGAKSSLNRAILAGVWGRFLTRLEHKLPDGAVLRVDPKNTSRTCADCGHTAASNRESQAVFACRSCGHRAHADTNAAVVILARAIGAMAPGHGVSGRGSPASAGSANQPAARRSRIPGGPSGEDVKGS